MQSPWGRTVPDLLGEACGWSSLTLSQRGGKAGAGKGGGGGGARWCKALCP